MSRKKEICSQKYATLIDSLYASLKNRQGFDPFLAELKNCFNGSSVALTAVASQQNTRDFAWSVGMAVAFEEWCRKNNTVSTNPSIQKFDRIGSSADGFVSVGQLLNGAELIDSVTDNLKPWIRKEAIIDTAGLIIPVSPQTHLLLAVQRNSSAGKFTEADIRQMNVLAPHIKQAVQLFIQFYHPENPHPDKETIQKLFNLTPTEAIVCQLLVTGLTLKDIARKRDVSVHTVREQMRQIYQKTGLKRQAEVVAAVLRCA